MIVAVPVIPYVKQSDPASGRTCGAACLSMVYGSFGVAVSQEEIWPNISKRNAFGSVASTTHLMARDAIERGFDAVVIQANHPLEALRVCLLNGIRVILNHRLDQKSPVGHYSVLANIDCADVILHDPLSGPSRQVGFAELLDMWRVGIPISETIGNVLIGIAPRNPAAVEPACSLCKLTIGPEVPCPKCQQPVRLRPSAVLGCVAQRCNSRLWNYLCCPQCDCTWSFHAKPDKKEAAAQPAPAAPKPADPLDVDVIYGDVNKFISQILEIPGASDHPDIRNQIAYLYDQKEPLRMAIAESAAQVRMQTDRLDVLRQTATANEAHNQRRTEEASRQSPPLDGDALGMALLRNLGFVR